ncbi:uncharacterized protein LOC141602168 [Silene latifolia]|uniref:uncharacterized protein LOC141602168 n=1 Tax=Silene latifolia TaxID=37657 RepID=UPI003D78AAD7
MYNLVNKLKYLKWPLKNLNKIDFDDVENNTARAKMYLESIQGKLGTDPQNLEHIQMEIEASSSVRFLEDACREFLVQKSRNTKYFHSIIKGWQIRAKVLKIEDNKGVLCENNDQIQKDFIDFYTDLLGTSTPVTKVSQNVIQMGKLCTSERHAILLTLVTNEEIQQVLFFIPTHKAVGPDGYSNAFFRDSWNTVGNSVCEAIENFYSDCSTFETTQSYTRYLNS